MSFAPATYQGPAPALPSLLSHSPRGGGPPVAPTVDGHREHQYPPVSPRTGYTDSSWPAHNKHSSSLSSAAHPPDPAPTLPTSHSSPPQQQPPPPHSHLHHHLNNHSPAGSSSSAPHPPPPPPPPPPPHPPLSSQHSARPAPQEPKLNGYEPQTSPSFGPGYSQSRAPGEWGRPAMPSFSPPMHHEYHPHPPTDYHPVNHGHHARQNSTYPPLPSPTSHYPTSRSYSESHIKQPPYRSESQYSPPLQHSHSHPPPPPPPPSHQHSPGLPYEHGFPNDRQQPPPPPPPPHQHYDPSRSSSFSLPSRRDLLPQTPPSGTISPGTQMDGHRMSMRRPSGTDALNALASATLTDSRSHQQLRQSISHPPYHSENSVYAPGPIQRHASFDSLASDRTDERALKRQRTDDSHGNQHSPLNPNSVSGSIPESNLEQNAPKGQQKKRKMTIDTSIPESSVSPTSAGLPSSASSHNYGTIPFNKEWGWTKGGKPRQRLPLACLSCRHKKIKCRPSDIQGERCAHCSKMNLNCEYGGKKESKKSKDGAKVRTTTSPDNSHPPPSTTSEQPPAVEDVMMKVKEEAKEDYSIPTETPVEPPIVPKYAPVQQTAVVYSPEPKDIMDVDSKQNLTTEAILIVNETTPNPVMISNDVQHMVSPVLSDAAYQRTSGVNNSFGRTTSGAAQTPQSYPSPASVSTPGAGPGEIFQSAKAKQRTSVTPKYEPSVPRVLNADHRHGALPEGPVLTHLVEKYFTHVYSQTYAFLHRETFMRNLFHDGKCKPVLLLALCAVAARFSEEQRCYEEFYAKHARHEILSNFDQNQLEVVQAMTLMGLHDFGSQNGDKAWMFCGMAVRMGAALNLNLPSKKNKSFIEQEIERRTYWSYYLMDRFNSYGVARPFLTQDDDCQIQLPVDQPSFDIGKPRHTEFLNGDNPSHPECGTEHMGAMAFLVRITSIWAKILRTIHYHRNIEKDPNCDAIKEKAFNELRRECLDWDRKLPKGLRYSSKNIAPQVKYGTVGSFVMMHVMFHASMIYLHRYINTVGVSKERLSATNSSTQKLVMGIRKAFVHGDAVLQIVEHVHQEREHARKKGEPEVVVIAPFLGHIIRDGCEIALKRLPTMPEGSARDNQLRRIKCGVERVKELKKYWKPLETISNQLEKLVQQQLKRQANKVASNSPAVSDSPLDFGSASKSPLLAMTQTASLMGPPQQPPTSIPYSYEPVYHRDVQTFEDVNAYFGGFGVPDSTWESAFDGSEHGMLMEFANQEFAFPALYDPQLMFDNGLMDVSMGADGGMMMGQDIVMTGVPVPMPIEAPVIMEEPVEAGIDVEEEAPEAEESVDEAALASTTYFSLDKAVEIEPEDPEDSEKKEDEDSLSPRSGAIGGPGNVGMGHNNNGHHHHHHGLGGSFSGESKENGVPKRRGGDLLTVLDMDQEMGLGKVVKEVEIAEQSACEKSVVNGETIMDDITTAPTPVSTSRV